MSSNEVPHRVRFGPYEADLRTHELFKHGTRLKLSGQPFQILEVLLGRPGDLITRDELKEKLWPEDTFVDFSHGLNAAVNKLRDALSDSADDPKYIETLPRRGYRFIGKVERVGLPEPRPEPAPVVAPAPVSVSTPPPTIASSPVLQIEHRQPARWSRVIFAVIGLFVALLGLALWIHGPFRGNEKFEMEARSESGPPPLVNVQEPVSDPELSPDGNQVAFRRKGLTPATAGIFVKHIGSDDLIQLTKSPADANPVWSGDGKTLAFTRSTEEQFDIYTVPAEGGEARRLSWPSPRPRSAAIDWSPAANTIAFSGPVAGGSSAIFLLSLDSLGATQLTHPPVGAIDSAPSFSPDGRHICFIRSQPEGFPQNLFLADLNGSDSRQVTSEHGQILGPSAWNADGQSVIYASTRTGEPALWRVSITGGEPVAVGNVGANVWHPTVSRRGFRLAYQQMRTASSILQMGVGANTASRKIVTSTRGRNEGPQLSPDGKRLVFMSNRSGSMEIWVSSADGSSPVQVTALNGAGTPRWAPDSKTITFDARSNEPGAIRGAVYTVSAEGGEAHLLVHGDSENLVPSFSRDGQFVYFGSDRDGDWRVWKTPIAGGTSTRVTTRGGFAAQEGSDGFLYYASSRYPNPEIWRVPVGGGDEAPLMPRIVPRTWASWAIAPAGIYFVEDSMDAGAVLSFYDFGTHQIRRVSALDKPPFWLGVSSDGSTVFMDQPNQEESSIMLQENFH